MRDATPNDRARQAHAAVEELLRRIADGRCTGEFCVRISANQGGITSVRLSTDEAYRPRE